MSSEQQRQVARRVFASEYNDATHLFKESDDEMAPKYALLPTGVRANRVFVVGTVTETNDVGNEQEYWQARVVDSTGTFFVYAGQYQPDAAAYFRELEPPEYAAVVGKPRTFETDDGDLRVTMRPEHVTTVTQRVRNNWVVETGLRTLDRIEEFEQTDFGSDMAPPDLQLAADQYDTDVSGYRSDIREAVESIT